VIGRALERDERAEGSFQDDPVGDFLLTVQPVSPRMV
jgi:hypothetical protein